MKHIFTGLFHSFGSLLVVATSVVCFVECGRMSGYDTVKLFVGGIFTIVVGGIWLYHLGEAYCDKYQKNGDDEK